MKKVIIKVLARSKDDYDIKEHTLHIYNTLTEDDNYNVIWSEHTKTFNKRTQIDEGERYLPLDNYLFKNLIQIINRPQKVSSISNIHNLLFWNFERDTYISPNEVNSYLNRINKKYNISKEILSTHRLRHTALTRWREAGMELNVIQYLAGHVEGSRITEETYIDTSLAYVKTVLNRIS